MPIALGDKHGAVSFHYDEAHSGATHVDTKEPGLIPVGKLDDYQLKNVGYVKIDTEGFELNVLEGARQTLLENKPIIIVEDKFHGVKHYGQKPYASIELLESLGAAVLDRVVDDFVVGWPDTPGKVAAVVPALRTKSSRTMWHGMRQRYTRGTDRLPQTASRSSEQL